MTSNPNIGQEMEPCPLCNAEVEMNYSYNNHPEVQGEDGRFVHETEYVTCKKCSYIADLADHRRISTATPAQVEQATDETFRFAQGIVGLANSLQGRDALDSEIVSVKLIRACAAIINGEAFRRMGLPPAAGDSEAGRLREALAPFAKALDDWGDDTGQPDHWNVWEHPIAMGVSLGDFRRAGAALAGSEGGR